MTTYHEGMKCAACDGPLEFDRTAVCHTCVPESQWFNDCAAVQEMSEAAGEVTDG